MQFEVLSQLRRLIVRGMSHCKRLSYILAVGRGAATSSEGDEVESLKSKQTVRNVIYSENEILEKFYSKKDVLLKI